MVSIIYNLIGNRLRKSPIGENREKKIEKIDVGVLDYGCGLWSISIEDLPVARSESLVHSIIVKGVHASFPICTNSRK